MVQDMPAQGLASSPNDQSIKGREANARGLLLVGLFKLSKAVFFTAVGLGALHLVHRNFGDLVQNLVNHLPVDPEGRFVGILLDKADLIGGHQLRRAGLLSFLYAALCVVEGVGLIRRKVWAEYVTVILTAGAMPWEMYEIAVHFAWYRVALLLLNLALLLYLLWVLKSKRRGEGPQLA